MAVEETSYEESSEDLTQYEFEEEEQEQEEVDVMAILNEAVADLEALVGRYRAWNSDSKVHEPKLPTGQNFEESLGILMLSTEYSAKNYERDVKVAEKLINKGSKLISTGQRETGDWMMKLGAKLLEGNRRGSRMVEVADEALKDVYHLKSTAGGKTVIKKVVQGSRWQMAALVAGALFLDGCAEKVTDMTALDAAVVVAAKGYEIATGDQILPTE